MLRIILFKSSLRTCEVNLGNVKRLHGDSDIKGIESKIYIDGNRRIISIAGAVNWQLADAFSNAMNDFGSLSVKRPVTVFINSTGGDIYDMFKVYDHLKSSPIPVVTIVAGCAFSAGLIIFLGGDLRKVYSNAFLGFHAPTAYFRLDSSKGPAETAEYAHHHDDLLNAMVRVVRRNSLMSEETIRKYFQVLTRIDARTALKFGLAHQIISHSEKILPKSWKKIFKEPK